MNRGDLAAIYQKYQGRALSDADVSALGGASGAWTSMTPQDFLEKTVFPSKEFQGNYPGVSTEGGFNLARGVKEAKGIYDPLTKRQNDLTQQQFETLKQNITSQLGKSKEGVASTLASRGLERSGELGYDTAQLETTAAQQIGAAGLQATLQQAENTATNWSNVYGMASQTEQALSGQEAQQFSEALQTHQQQLTDLGFPVQQYTNIGQLWEGFLNANIDPSRYQWIYEGLKGSMDKMGDIKSM